MNIPIVGENCFPNGFNEFEDFLKWKNPSGQKHQSLWEHILSDRLPKLGSVETWWKPLAQSGTVWFGMFEQILIKSRNQIPILSPHIGLPVGITVSCLSHHLGVSKNDGTPKSSHFNRVSHCKSSILGFSPYFWKNLFVDTQNFCQRFGCVHLHHWDLDQLPNL